MVVQTQDKRPGHSGALGLHIGEVNVSQYFPRGLQIVELELDHLRISCTLEPDFWLDRPEIHDYRLSSWLELKRNSGKLASHSAPVALIPCGVSAFRLQLIAKDERDQSLTAPPPASYFTPTIPVAALLDRRKRNLGRNPDRRKVGKLGVDERAISAVSH